jgi:hypothetical protein
MSKTAIKEIKVNGKLFRKKLKRQSHRQWNQQGYPRRKGSGKLGFRRRLHLIQQEIDTGVPFGQGEKWVKYHKKMKKAWQELSKANEKEKLKNGDTIQSDLPDVR